MAMHSHTTFRAGFETLTRECPGVALPLTGTLPTWLTGALLRTGPAQFEAGQARYRHWFDGLAMLHRFDFAGGVVKYTNKFLESASFKAARKTQTIAMSEFATDPDRSFWGRIMAGIKVETTDNGNVNVVSYGGDDAFVALTETPKPIRFDPKSLATRGAFEWSEAAGGALTTAHPQWDATRKLIYNYEVLFGRRSTYRVYKMAPSTGVAEVMTEITADRPAYMHSFAMSARYLVLTEFPLLVHPLRLMFGGTPFIEAYRWMPERGLRITVIDKDTGAVVKQTTTEAAFGFHHVNAYDEDATVVVDVVAHPDAKVVKTLYLDPLRDHGGTLAGTYTRYRIPLGNGEVMRETLSNVPLELPRIDYAGHAGRKHRYVWANSQHEDAFLDCVVKYDLEGGALRRWRVPGGFPGEPVFVPEPGATAEDQGVLLTLLLDTTKSQSAMVVLDAADLTEIARAEIPHIVPFGFHGNYFADAA